MWPFRKVTAMVDLEIKQWHSSDVDDLTRWRPATREEVYFPLELNIGERGDPASDIFDVLIATPEALRERARTLVLAERAILLVGDYHWPEIERAIQEIVQHCAAPTWTEAVLRLQLYFRWEYEDYAVETDTD